MLQLIFRDRERGEKEINITVRENHWLAASCICPKQGSNPQSGYVPYLRFESTTFLCMAWHSNKLSNQSGSHHIISISWTDDNLINVHETMEYHLTLIMNKLELHISTWINLTSTKNQTDITEYLFYHTIYINFKISKQYYIYLGIYTYN